MIYASCLALAACSARFTIDSSFSLSFFLSFLPSFFLSSSPARREWQKRLLLARCLVPDRLARCLCWPINNLVSRQCVARRGWRAGGRAGGRTERDQRTHNGRQQRAEQRPARPILPNCHSPRARPLHYGRPAPAQNVAEAPQGCKIVQLPLQHLAGDVEGGRLIARPAARARACHKWPAGRPVGRRGRKWPVAERQSPID